MNKSDEQQNINAWKKQNPLFARLNPNVSQEGAIGNGPAVGIAHINDTAAVNKYLAMRQVRELCLLISYLSGQ